jgi:hypothetical protein
MIVTYPLIVSKTVNPNILPGICKALEKYIYTHRVDGVIEAANQNIKAQNAKSGMYIALKNIGGKTQFRLENTTLDRTIEDYLTEDWSEENEAEDYVEEKKSGTQTVVQTKYDAAGTKTGSSQTVSPNKPAQKFAPKQTKKDYYNQGY